MANLQAILNGQSIIEQSPKACLRNSNMFICKNIATNTFITLFYGVLNTRTGQITYCNCGHNQPLYIKSNLEVKLLHSDGIPLGILSDFEYEQEEIQLEKGSMLAVFSDGVTEARNSNKEEFGEDRLEEILKRSHSKSAAEVVEEILKKIEDFTRDTPQTDDITLMIIRREM